MSKDLIERDYVETFYCKLTLEMWGEIVDGAISAAKEGDAKAREWITRLVLGESPMTLTELAQRRALGVQSEHEIAALRDEIENPDEHDAILKAMGNLTRLDRARRIAQGLPTNGAGARRKK